MEEFEISNESPKISKYNSGVAQIYRLDELWKDTHKLSRGGLLDAWNFTLDRVWSELAGDLKPNDERVKTFSDINKRINDLQNILFDKKIKIDSYRTKFYLLLMEKELFLRRLQNEIGKGSAYQDDMDDYFDD